MNLPEVIAELRSTDSHIAKIEILERNKTLLTLPLYYAYSPFMKYHIRQMPASLVGQGSATINQGFYMILAKIVKRKLVGERAKKVLGNYIEFLTPEHAEIAKLIVKKNLNIGCNAALINKAFAGELIETHKVMLAKRYDSTTPLEYPKLVSPKIDGIRAVFRNDSFYSRAGHTLIGLDHLKTTINFRGVHHTLDGELYVPGSSFDELSGRIRSHATDKPEVKYAVFDIINEHPLTERYEYLQQVFPAMGQGFNVEHVPNTMVTDLEQVNFAYRKYREAGLEGLMIKSPTAKYQKKRSKDWLKMKPLYSSEYNIVSIFEGEGRLTGTLGGFVINNNGSLVRVGSGFSEAERDAFWKAPPIGKWATVEAMEKTPSGSLRHPIYRGIRWDINI